MDRAVGKHRLHPRHQRAHRPEAQHLGAAGIGRGEAADGRAPARAQGQRKAHSDFARALVQIGEDHPGLGDGEPVLRADRTQSVHPPKRQDQLRPVGSRSGARDHAGVAALRHQRDAVLAGQPDDLDHFLGRFGARIARAAPWTRPRQSVSHGAISAGSVIAAFAPSRCSTAATICEGASLMPAQ